MAALWMEFAAAALNSTGNTTVFFTMMYTLGYELCISLVYDELNIRLINQGAHITKSFAPATHALGIQNIPSRYPKLT